MKVGRPISPILLIELLAMARSSESSQRNEWLINPFTSLENLAEVGSVLPALRG